MKTEERIKELEEKVGILEDLLVNPSEETSLVLYLVKTLREMERVNLDLTHKWNCAAAFVTNMGLVENYNAWYDQLEAIENPQMKQLFMMKAITGEKQPEIVPDCGMANPHREGIICSDIKGHDGDIHMGVDGEGQMFKWTETEDLGIIKTEDLPEAPEIKDEALGARVGELMRDIPNGEELFKTILTEMEIQPGVGMTNENMRDIIKSMEEAKDGIEAKPKSTAPPENPEAIKPEENPAPEDKDPEGQDYPSPSKTE